MITIELSLHEWQQVLGLLALGPWRDANPLMMKIGAQLQRQAPNMEPAPARPAVNGSKEVER